MKLGPDGFDKIAIIGSAPDSIALAPFDDPSWALWCCSPGAFATVASRRSDVWFETHRYQPSQPGKAGAPGTRPWFSPEFHAFLRAYPGPVFLSQTHPDIPNSVRIPFEALIEKYGPYHFTSSIALMLAMAIDQQPKAIGLWGVDMSASEEYGYQRPGCQHFIGMAAALGIQIALPPESDLLRHPVVYGMGELSERHIKISARIEFLNNVKNSLTQQQQQIAFKLAETQGALGDAEYMLATWSDDLKPDIRAAFSFASKLTPSAAPANAPTPTPVEVTEPAVAAAEPSTGAAVLDLKAGA